MSEGDEHAQTSADIARIREKLKRLDRERQSGSG